PRLEPQLPDGPDRPDPARYRFLQIADGADDLGEALERRGALRPFQPHVLRPPRRADRSRRAEGAARPCAHAALPAERADLAQRPGILRRAQPLLAGLYRLPAPAAAARL